MNSENKLFIIAVLVYIISLLFTEYKLYQIEQNQEQCGEQK